MQATVTGKLEAVNDAVAAGVEVTFALYPAGIAVFGPDGSELLVAPVSVRTRSDGTYSASLERTDTMVPSGMVYCVSIVGQPSVYITVPAGGGTVVSLLTPPPGSVAPPGVVTAVVAGSGTAVDATNPQRPVVSVTTYTFTQSTPSATWVVTHNLGRFPSVTVVDGAGNVVAADIQYVDANNLLIGFSSPQAGKVYLN